MSTFFISSPIGFEQTTLEQLKEVWPLLLGKDARPHGLPFPECTIHQGGLELECDFVIGVQFNFFLKTANRVLLRMADFRVRDMPKFYNKFKDLPWIEYLKSYNVEWEVAAQGSRVNNEKRLQESAQTALNELFGFRGSKEPAGRIYIRMIDDHCTISLDSTGDHLHKRGVVVLKGDAPLRETIAAYMIQQIQNGTTPEERANVTLLDPMMGSGTILCEARSEGVGTFARPFAFQNWKKVPKLFLSETFAFNYNLPVPRGFKKYVGFDISAEMVKAATANFAEAERQISAVQKKKFQAADVSFMQKDALKAEPLPGPLWMILNPPYGERLPVAGGQGLKALAAELCSRYAPERLGLLYPATEQVSVVPKGYKLHSEHKVNNGGIRCLYTILVKV